MEKVNIAPLLKEEFSLGLMLLVTPNIALSKLVLRCQEGESLTITRREGVTHVVSVSSDGRTTELSFDIPEEQIQKYIAADG